MSPYSASSRLACVTEKLTTVLSSPTTECWRETKGTVAAPERVLPRAAPESSTKATVLGWSKYPVCITASAGAYRS